MNVVITKHLNEAAARHPNTANEIAAWAAIVKHVRWTSSTDVRQVFGDADSVGGYVVFDLRRNRYRLVTVIHYARERNGKPTEGHVYIRSFLTHKEYDIRANRDKEYRNERNTGQSR